jgi:hypothetical protein
VIGTAVFAIVLQHWIDAETLALIPALLSPRPLREADGQAAEEPSADDARGTGLFTGCWSGAGRHE